jgi:hypothetical protein
MGYSETLPDETILGEIPGIQSGAFFGDRQELHDKKLHRGLMRGIAPHGSSIVLSGGYVDDEDLGDVIIYTGEGGRDSNSGRQIADQRFEAGNKALAENHLNGIPIRVHRGKAHVGDMPEGYRYRYDGLYRVAKYWEEVGRAGLRFGVFGSKSFYLRISSLCERNFLAIVWRMSRRPVGTKSLTKANSQLRGPCEVQRWESG